MQRTNRAAAALLLLVALAAPVAAGAQDAAISGTVTDTTGLVLPGVTVEARDAAGDPAGTAVSGAGTVGAGCRGGRRSLPWSGVAATGV